MGIIPDLFAEETPKAVVPGLFADTENPSIIPNLFDTAVEGIKRMFPFEPIQRVAVQSEPVVKETLRTALTTPTKVAMGQPEAVSEAATKWETGPDIAVEAINQKLYDLYPYKHDPATTNPWTAATKTLEGIAGIVAGDPEEVMKAGQVVAPATVGQFKPSVIVGVGVGGAISKLATKGLLNNALSVMERKLLEAGYKIEDIAKVSSSIKSRIGRVSDQITPEAAIKLNLGTRTAKVPQYYETTIPKGAPKTLEQPRTSEIQPLAIEAPKATESPQKPKIEGISTPHEIIAKEVQPDGTTIPVYRAVEAPKPAEIAPEAPVKAVEHPKVENTLIEEARKYKTAEEFVKEYKNKDITTYDPNAIKKQENIANDILGIIENNDDGYLSFGLRSLPERKKPYKVGQYLKNSYQWNDGHRTRKQLDGTSAIGVSGDLDYIKEGLKTLHHPQEHTYPGSKIALVIGEHIKNGEDEGEVLLGNVKILKIYDKSELPLYKYGWFDEHINKLTDIWSKANAPLAKTSKEGEGIIDETSSEFLKKQSDILQKIPVEKSIKEANISRVSPTLRNATKEVFSGKITEQEAIDRVKAEFDKISKNPETKVKLKPFLNVSENQKVLNTKGVEVTLEKGEPYRVIDLGSGKIRLQDGKQVTIYEGELKNIKGEFTDKPNIAAGGIKHTDMPRPVGLEEIVKEATPLNKKINVLDYFRTPEFVLQKIGLAKEAVDLRKGYDAYLKELPKNIDKITQWAKRAPSEESNKKIFAWLDGENVILDSEEGKVASEIKDWLEEWANRLALPTHQRVTNYITHLFNDQLIKKEFDEDLAKIIADRVAGSVYDPFLEHRTGSVRYKTDTWKALDAYVKRATRKANMDKALEEISEAANSLELSQWDYIKRYVDRVNMRPTDIDNLLDNGIKQIIGYRLGQRPTAVITRFLRQVTYRAKLGLNVSSALRNLSQGINTYAKLGEKYTFIGYTRLLNSKNQQELSDEGVLQSGFIEDRTISATKKAIEKIDKGLFYLFETVERINRGAAYFGGKAKMLAKGKSEKEAIEYGKKIVRETQFLFGAIDQPLALQSDIAKTLMQLQNYTVKQTEFLGNMVKDKNFIGLARYIVSGLAFVSTIGMLFAMRKKELIPSLRWGVSPALSLPYETAKAIFNVPNKYGKTPDISGKIFNITKEVIGMLPASAQATKTIQGINAVNEGAVFNKGGTKLFDIPDNLFSKIQAVLFGRYASSEAREYFGSKGKPKDSGKREYSSGRKYTSGRVFNTRRFN
jgi:hypothetical protein